MLKLINNNKFTASQFHNFIYVSHHKYNKMIQNNAFLACGALFCRSNSATYKQSEFLVGLPNIILLDEG